MDVAILGAGPVGATLAALASGGGRSIGVFEARAASSGDRRILALSQAGRALLEDAGAWPADRATPITSIHVSQKGGPGRAVLEARDAGLEALGHTVRYADLEAALDARLAASGVEVARGESCEDIALDDAAARLRLSSGREVRARLLVLADGGANSSRIPGIGYAMKDYGQKALTAVVTTDRAHGGRAYERFTPRGPAALLPLEDRFALVWTETPAAVDQLLALDEAAFLAGLQAHFGDRAGRFTSVGARTAFALTLRTVNTNTALRTAIVGNAAQALHPIAGQGLNLGLRDAADLAALIRSRPAGTIGDSDFLRDYRESRRSDALRGVAFTDFLVSAFADRGRVSTWGRGLALTFLDVFPPARRALAERMIRGAVAS